MTTRHRLVAVALLAAAPFSLTACGGNAQADHAKASLKAMLLKDQNSASSATPLKFSDGQAGCVASTVVDKIGLQELQTAGLLNKSNNAVENSLQTHKLVSGDATTLVNAMFDCTGGGAIIVTKLKDAILAQAASAPASAQACISTHITASFTKQFMVAALTGKTQTQGLQLLQSTLGTCVAGSH